MLSGRKSWIGLVWKNWTHVVELLISGKKANKLLLSRVAAIDGRRITSFASSLCIVNSRQLECRKSGLVTDADK